MPDNVVPLRQLDPVSASRGLHDLRSQLGRAIFARSESAFAAGDAARDAIKSLPALKQRQQMARQALIDAIGGLPALDAPLNVRTTGRLQEEGFSIENLIFESARATPVTCNLYLPDGITKPRGAVLFLCGHHLQAKQVPEYQVVCRHLVAAGLVVLAMDPIGQGERLSYYEPELGETTVAWGTTEHDHAGAQSLLLGDGIARYFLRDAMRAVDVLAGRPEVDPKRIGVTGNSGGGTQTCLMMLADPRLAAAAPATFLMNRRSYLYGGGAQDCEQIWPGLTALGLDHEDILLTLCPKPVCVLAVQYDFFPIEGTRETVDRCRRLWKLAGKPASLELVEDRSTHCYTPRLARAAARFFSKHLLGREAEVRSDAIRAIDPTRLACTRSGQVRADFPRARFVYDENRARLAALERTRRALTEAARKRRAAAWLKQTITADRVAVPANLRCHERLHRSGDLLVDFGYWWSQAGILNEGLMFRHYKNAGRRLSVTVALWDDGTKAVSRHADWIRALCAKGRAVLVVSLTGMGGAEPNPLNLRHPQEPYGAFHKYNDDLIWLGDSLCAMRAWDVARVPAALAEWPNVDGRDLRFFADGRAGVYAELAAAVMPGAPAVDVQNPMPGFADWVKARVYDQYECRAFVLPGVLAWCDLPDLRRWRKARTPGKPNQVK